MRCNNNAARRQRTPSTIRNDLRAFVSSTEKDWREVWALAIRDSSAATLLLSSNKARSRNLGAIPQPATRSQEPMGKFGFCLSGGLVSILRKWPQTVTGLDDWCSYSEGSEKTMAADAITTPAKLKLIEAHFGNVIGRMFSPTWGNASVECKMNAVCYPPTPSTLCHGNYHIKEEGKKCRDK